MTSILGYLFHKPAKPATTHVKPALLTRPANHSFPSEYEGRLEYAKQMLAADPTCFDH